MPENFRIIGMDEIEPVRCKDSYENFQVDGRREIVLNNNTNTKHHIGKKIFGPEKQTHLTNVSNRGVYNRKYIKPPPVKRKSAPVSVRLSNPSAEAVLRERKVEIKDLESQVVYLQNQMKEIKIENKTLLDVQCRQEKELKKFKEGVADIPALLRSHRDEMKAMESTVATVRRELKDCQKDLKSKSDVILRKEQNVDKLNASLKHTEKHMQEVVVERKRLKSDNRRLEEENKKLLNGNEELKSKNEWMLKKIQHMQSTILSLEENLGTSEHYKSQLKDDISKLQKKFDELVQQEAIFKKSLSVLKSETCTQTSVLETCCRACMTDHSADEEKGDKVSVSCMTEDLLDRGLINTNLKSNLEEPNVVNYEFHSKDNTRNFPTTARDAFPYSFPTHNPSNDNLIFPSTKHSQVNFMRAVNSRKSIAAYEKDFVILQSRLTAEPSVRGKKDNLKTYLKIPPVQKNHFV